jgi:RNA polymerase sigma factor (sigma-70 family)
MSTRLRLPNPLSALDDRALLARYADQHDHAAFEQVVKRHRGLVFGVCRRAVRDQHIAEDAYQAAFLVLARNPRAAITATSVSGWLFGVARRVSLAARRHEQRQQRRAALAVDKASPEPAKSDLDDFRQALDEELAALPDDARAAVVACFLEERTQDEAARELGWSLSTLRRRLEQGKDLLRSRLARRGITLAITVLASTLASPVHAIPPAIQTTPLSATLAAQVLKQSVSAKIVSVFVVATLTLGGLAFATIDTPAMTPPKAEARTPEVPTAIAPAPRAVETQPWTTITGRVTLPKKIAVPDLKNITQLRDEDAFKPFLPLVDQTLLVNPENRGIANAVVWLRPDTENRKDDFPATHIHANFAKHEPQEHPVQAIAGQFSPHVLAVRAGDTIKFTNRLPVSTNIRYITNGSAAQGEVRDFNLLFMREMSHTTKPIPRTQIFDSFQSNVHPWMTGYVWAFDHPYFAVTDGDGNFTIPNAPVGNWRVVVWHEACGYRQCAPATPAAARLGEKITIPQTARKQHNFGSIELESNNWPKP